MCGWWYGGWVRSRYGGLFGRACAFDISNVQSVFQVGWPTWAQAIVDHLVGGVCVLVRGGF